MARLFRRLFLAALEAAFDKGELRFFGGGRAPLCEPSAFAERIVTLRKTDWIVYAKPPFGGPEQVLAYHTHRAAIANLRQVSAGDDGVAFSYKDYRRLGRRQIMRLSPGEFIRRFLLHVLPTAYRIRHYGLLVRSDREGRLARCRRLAAADHPVEPNVRTCEDSSTVAIRAAFPCPDCGGLMRRIGIVPTREASPVSMRHVMNQAIFSARNPAQLSISLVAGHADGAPPHVASAKIFIIMTPIPRQTATNSSLLDRFPLTRGVLTSRHKRRREARPCAKRQRDAPFPIVA